MSTKNFFVKDGLKVKGNTLLNGANYNDTALAKLHVKSAANGVSANLNNVNGLIVENSGTSDSNYIFKLATGSGNIFNITNSGKVGVGTTSPVENLTVVGNISASGSIYGNVEDVTMELENLEVENFTVTGATCLNTLSVSGDSTLASVTATELVLSGDVEADEFVGNLRGAVSFTAKASGALTKGDAVYIAGISGNTTVVDKADADDASKMPAFGIASETVNANANVTIINFGAVTNLDTSSYTEGTELYISTTAGQLTNTAPTGEGSLVQKIAKVTRQDNAAGSITVMGAGRTNAVPNLNQGSIFVGNSSNQAVADNSVYVKIGSNPRIGIGTTNPATDLHIYSETAASRSIRVTSCDGAGNLYFGDCTDPSKAGFTVGQYARTMTLVAGCCSLVTLNNTNDCKWVGVGTASPNAPLHVYTDSAVSETVAKFEKGLGDSTLTISSTCLGIKLKSTGCSTINVDSTCLAIGTNSPTALLDVRGTTNISGTVGIGTTSACAAAKLHVNRDDTIRTDVILENNDNTANAELASIQYRGLDNGNASQLYAQIVGLVDDPTAGSEQGRLSFETVTSGSVSPRMTIDGSNVGIGTSSPNEKLTVVGNISATGSIYGNIEDVSLNLTLSEGTLFVGNSANTATEDSTIFVDTANSRVGIGTTSPDTILHVRSANELNARFESTDSGSRILIKDNDTNTYINAADSVASIGQNAGLNTSNLNILSNGSVGIGTISPNYKLEIDGTTDFGNTTTYNDGAAGLISWNAGTKFKIKGQSSHALSLGANGTEDYVWIATDGNVGIGTIAPNEKLTVSGNISASGTVYADAFSSVTGGDTIDFNDNLHLDGNLTVNGTISGNDVFTIGGGGTSSGGMTSSPGGSTDIYGLKLSRSSNNRAGSDIWDASSDSIVIGTTSSDTTFTVTSGAVGIGITNPDRALHVKPTSDVPAIKVGYDGTQGNGSLIEFDNGYTQKFYVGMSDTYASRDFVIAEVSLGSSTDATNPKYVFNGNGDGSFYITDAADNDVRVLLNTNGDSYLSGGNVGIGTASPSTLLTLHQASDTSTGGLRIQNSDNSSAFRIWKQPSGGASVLVDNGVDTMFIKNGDVGIGTSSPNEKLTVSGNISASGTVYADAFNSTTGGSAISFNDDVTLAGSLTATNICATSNITNCGNIVSCGNVIQTAGCVIACTCVQTPQVLGTKISVGSLNAGYDFYNNGTSYLNGATTIDDTVTISCHICMAGGSGSRLHFNGLRWAEGSTSGGGQLTLAEDYTLAQFRSSLCVCNDLTVAGNFTVHGTTTTLNTTVTATSAMCICNAGTGPALELNQTGTQPVVDLQDDGTSVFYIEDGGNVGIGTTNPDKKLHVFISDTGVTPDANSNLVIEDNDSNNFINVLTNNTSQGGIFFGDSDDNNIAGMLYNHSDDTLRFRTNNTNTRLSITSGGYVGVGTDNPQTKLQIDSGSGIGTIDSGYSLSIRGDGIDGIQILSDSAYQGRIIFGDQNSNTVGRIDYDHSTDAFRLHTNGTEKFSILCNGNVGIGTTNPLAKLHVSAGSQDGILIDANNALLGKKSTDNTYTQLMYWNGDVVYYGRNTTAPASHTVCQHQFRTGGTTRLTLTTSEAIFNDGGNNYDFRVEGDTDTGLFFVDASTDRVGIGHTAPTEKLFVKHGTINSTIARFTGANLDRGLVIGTAASGITNDSLIEYDAISTNSVGQHAFKTDGTERVRINESGNVGIGTTCPLSELHIEKSLTGDSSQLRITNGAGATVRMGITGSGANDSAHIKTNSGENLEFQIGQAADAATPSVMFKSGGDVGIGVSPSTRLHVSYPAVGQSGSAVTSLSTTQATDLGVKLSFTGGDNSNGNIIGGIALGNGGEEYAGIYAVDGGSSAATDLALFAGDTNGINEAIRIDSSGNVGIGTTSPTNLLTVNGGSESIGVYFSTNPNPRLTIGADGTWNYFKGKSGQGHYFNTTGGAIFVIQNGGNIGIGTASPNEKLTVSGNISASGVIYGDTFCSNSGSSSTIDFNDNLDIDGYITASDYIETTNTSTTSAMVMGFKDQFKRTYTTEYSFTQSGSGLHTFNLAFPTPWGSGLKYKAVLIIQRQGSAYTFGSIEDNSYIYRESDNDFTHRSEDQVLVSSGLGSSNSVVLSGNISSFNTDYVTSSTLSGTSPYDYYVVRYPLDFNYNFSGTNKIMVHLETYNYSGPDPVFTIA